MNTEKFLDWLVELDIAFYKTTKEPDYTPSGNSHFYLKGSQERFTSKDMELIDRIKNYDEIELIKIQKDMFIHWDNNFWYALSIFLIIQTALLYGLFDVYKEDSDIVFKIAIPIMGIILTVLMALLLIRRNFMIIKAKEGIEEKIPNLNVNHKDNKSKCPLQNFSSSKIMCYIFPSFFLIMWFCSFILLSID